MTTVFPKGQRSVPIGSPKGATDSFPAWAKTVLFYGWIFVIRHVAGFSPLLTSFFFFFVEDGVATSPDADIQILRVSHVILSCANQYHIRVES
jgi:hypothetical protein